MEENIIVCPCNLYGRTAIALHQFADSISCSISLKKIGVDRNIDCSSLIGILSLGIVKGDKIKIEINNGNFQSNFDKIVGFLKSCA